MSETTQARPTVLGDVPEEADPETRRTAQVVGSLLRSMWSVIEEQDCTYSDYDNAKEWLIQVGNAGEWPLFLDVFFERVIERNTAAQTSAGPSAIQGPFYVPDAPMLGSRGEVPMRPDEKGERLTVRGRVVSSAGGPIPGAIIDHWQADCDGFYSHFHPSTPDGNLRARFQTDADGTYEIHTVLPGPYMIPCDGPTGKLLSAAGWHPWRPAHLHYFVDADGSDRLTTQLFFEGDKWLGSDVAGSDKQELTVSPTRNADGTLEVEWDFVLQPGGSKRLGHSAEQ